MACCLMPDVQGSLTVLIGMFVSGLEFMMEYQKEDIRLEPYYMCELCEEKIENNQVTAHVTSLKHKILFMVSKSWCFRDKKRI